MLKRIFVALFLILLTLGAWILDQWATYQYSFSDLTKSLFAITVTYIFFKIIILTLIDRKVKDRKAEYLFKRLNNTIFYVIAVFWLLTIWVENTETLLLSYGLLSAAVALALQDVFKDLIGGFILLGTANYRVGDRIETGDTVGDVVKISLLYTTVMEIKNWVDGDQPTGRLVTIPNGLAARSIVNNYNRDHQFIWDEIVIPITYESDWEEAAKTFKDILSKQQAPLDDSAIRQIEELSKKYYLEDNVLEPGVFIKLTDNWIELHLRYITETKKRRIVKSDLNKLILKLVQENKNINIASNTLKILK